MVRFSHWIPNILCHLKIGFFDRFLAWIFTRFHNKLIADWVSESCKFWDLNFWCLTAGIMHMNDKKRQSHFFPAFGLASFFLNLAIRNYPVILLFLYNSDGSLRHDWYYKTCWILYCWFRHWHPYLGDKPLSCDWTISGQKQFWLCCRR